MISCKKESEAELENYEGYKYVDLQPDSIELFLFGACLRAYPQASVLLLNLVTN
jgi:hypothetical protein